MIVGSSGTCLENCGDGMNFGLKMCDDGNTRSGDGCSSKCLVEKGFTCTGGYPYSKDNCSYVPTEFLEVKVNVHNDLLLKFSRPINLPNGTLTPKDLVLSYRNSTGFYQTLSYILLQHNPLPSRFLYLKTERHEDFKGGIFRDNMVEIRYMNTKSIIDSNGYEVKKDTSGLVWMNREKYFSKPDKLEVELYSKYILWFISGTFGYWLVIALIS
jgi:cysteine-rich repeat protein